MITPYTTVAKIVLGVGLGIFCGVVVFYALGVGNLTTSVVSNFAQWAAIVILFMITMILPHARRLDAARTPGQNINATKNVGSDNGQRAIKTGMVLLLLSVVLFFFRCLR